jgi:tetratricopeptide (TPR) repeat protein
MYMRSRFLATGAAFGLLLAMQPARANDYRPLMKAKKYAEVERVASAKLAQDPANANAMVARTDAILAGGGEARVDEAVKQAEKCVATQPANAACHVSLGKALGSKAMLGGMMAAMSHAGTIRDAFKKAVELDPRNVEARFGLLQFYMMAPSIAGGGTGKAETLTAQTVAINPEAAKLMQAKLDLAADKLAKAEAAALAVQPGTDPDLLDEQEGVLVGVGMKYITEKKLADSERVLRDAQKRFPDSDNPPYGIARIQQEQGKHREALAGFEQVLTKLAKPHVHYRIAQSQLALGDKAKAAASFEKALAFKSGLSKKMRSDAEDQLKALKG